MAVATALGAFTFDVARIRRRVAVENVLARLGPPGGRREAERIARESYRVVARTFTDLFRGDRESEESLWRMIRRSELDHAVRVWKEGRGGLLVSGHFGNWELMVLAVRRLGVPVGAMGKDQSNEAVNEQLRQARTRSGITPLSSSRRGLREVVRFLRRGGYVATLMDQDAGRRGMFVDFLGTPASTHVGTVSMAVRTGTPLLPGVLIDERGRSRIVLAEPWRPPPPEECSPDEAVRQGVLYYTRFLEEQVRAHPENYFWAHRRWKTRPPAESGGAR
jgi:KDO2-lipid IV(A) lauroyltransferase